MTVEGPKAAAYALYRRQACIQIELLMDNVGEKLANASYSQLVLYLRGKHDRPKRVSLTRCGRSFLVYARIMQEIHALLTGGAHLTKRELFYRHVQLFRHQCDVDTALDAIARTLAVPRDALNVGLVFGDAVIRSGSSQLDCSKHPLAIPRDELIDDLAFAGKHVLVFEKDAVFQTAAQDIGWLREALGPILIVTGKGYPDLATVDLLSRSLPQTCSISVFVDFDPHGLEIYEHYQRHVCCARLGVTYADIKHYSEMSHRLLPLTAHDSRKIRCLLKRSAELQVETVKDLHWMQYKCELEIMCEQSNEFMTRRFLLDKLRHKK